ncbi:MAG: PilZ domain-containing protein [Arenimonas sp.]
MNSFDKRQYPRRPVNLAAVIVPITPAPATAVIDLSEGGAGLEWNLPDDIEVGAMVRLRFLLAGEQSIEIEGCIVRIANGRAGVEFLSAQETLVRQLLAEARSAEDY